MLTGNVQEKVEEILNGVYLSLDKSVVQKPKNRKIPMIREYSVKSQVENVGNQKRSLMEVSISGKQKTCLEDIWKVFYKDNQQKSGYFLVNDYQKSEALDDLVLGKTKNIMLVSGWKHEFFSRII
ncbi:hypothetical protein [endosymbiont GvMRE of Glomus versiforme]|uniref:hypothetical protein n=1 Tax=endosymbiont GvMRE of Glomus versiforme TaxID=2039283 RepID=UPI0011C43925|nr:hypothetical protein [endosymbiont GvMRE of Glomus versiforme]